MNVAIYQTDHLFLLAGENSLPNAIAALSLLRPGGTPYLIHTQRTKTQADYLAMVLGDFPTFQPAQLIDLGTSQAEASVIRQKIQAIAHRIPKDRLAGRVGMNYTGGTKPMAVHAYRAVEACHPNAVFSYLDSNTLEMMIDRDQGTSVRVKVSPTLSLEQLFRLHGLSWQPDHPPGDRPIQPEAAALMVRFYQSKDLRNAWRRWCDGVLRPATQNEYHRWRDESELVRVGGVAIASLPPVIREEMLATYFHASPTQLDLRLAPKLGFSSIAQLCAWLDGTWLEHDTLSHIQQVAPTLDIHDSRVSFNIRDPMKPNQLWAKFEFDVAFSRHYQLFALSCTTSSSRAVCKQKLLEASVRARQLGGSEARVGLVCCYHRPDSLRSELEVATRNRKIAVFGRSDLRSLGKKIAEWVKWNG